MEMRYRLLGQTGLRVSELFLVVFEVDRPSVGQAMRPVLEGVRGLERFLEHVEHRLLDETLGRFGRYVERPLGDEVVLPHVFHELRLTAEDVLEHVGLF